MAGTAGRGTKDDSECVQCGKNYVWPRPSTRCPPGQYLDGCGGVDDSIGTCTSCAASCDDDGYYMNVTCLGFDLTDTAKASCTACGTCAAGEVLEGCSGYSAGTCVPACQGCLAESDKAGKYCNTSDTCAACAKQKGDCDEGSYLARECDGTTLFDPSLCVACEACSADQYRGGCGVGQLERLRPRMCILK